MSGGDGSTTSEIKIGIFVTPIRDYSYKNKPGFIKAGDVGIIVGKCRAHKEYPFQQECVYVYLFRQKIVSTPFHPDNLLLLLSK